MATQSNNGGLEKLNAEVYSIGNSIAVNPEVNYEINNSPVFKGSFFSEVLDLLNDYIVRPSRYPDQLTETEEGDSIDMTGGIGLCTCVHVVGTVTGSSPSMTTKIQESSDNSTWTDIEGATFGPVSAAVNLQIINFKRTKRYVRIYSTITGTNPVFNYVALIIQRKEVVVVKYK